jgi:hypothetical protein
MADTVDTIVQLSGKNRYFVRLYNVSDGTGETNVIKVDKSTLTNVNGVEPTKLNLVSVQWSIQGFSSVRLAWDHTTDDEMVVLGSGQGYMDFSEAGALADPGSTGATGDVLLTTGGAVSGASYNIVLELVMSGNAT